MDTYNDFSGFSDGYYGGYGDYGDYSGGYSSGSGLNISQLENSLGQAIMTFLAVYMIIIVFIMIVKLGLYILKGCGMYTLAKRQHVEYPGLAFVPFARFYLQGELSGDIVLKHKKVRNPGIWLIVLPIAWNVIFGICYAMLIGMMTAAGIAIASSAGFGGALGGGLLFILLFSVVAIFYTAIQKGLTLMVNYQIYGRMTSNNMALVHAIFGIFIPCYEAICMFVMSRKKFNPRFEEYFANLKPKYETVMSEENVPSASGMTGAENVQPASEVMGAVNMQPTSEVMDAANVQPTSEVMDAANIRQINEVVNAPIAGQQQGELTASRSNQYQDVPTASESQLVEGAIDALKSREVEEPTPKVIELPTSVDAEKVQPVEEASAIIADSETNESYQFQNETADKVSDDMKEETANQTVGETVSQNNENLSE